MLGDEDLDLSQVREAFQGFMMEDQRVERLSWKVSQLTRFNGVDKNCTAQRCTKLFRAVWKAKRQSGTVFIALHTLMPLGVTSRLPF